VVDAAVAPVLEDCLGTAFGSGSGYDCKGGCRKAAAGEAEERSEHALQFPDGIVKLLLGMPRGS
jgi:hypothetical protein